MRRSSVLPLTLFIAALVAIKPAQAVLPSSDSRSDVVGVTGGVDFPINPDWLRDGDNQGDEFGHAVAGAGDVNGDGYGDIIVGAAKATHTVSREGVAYVFHGASNGPGETPDWQAGGGQRGSEFGAAVSAAGDVNGDTYDDVIVGAPQYDNGESNEGAAFVFFGSESGLSTSYDWMADGDQAEAEFGVSVSVAGHVNDDPFSDVIVGAVEYDGGQADAGAAFVFHGSADGPANAPNWVITGSQAYAGFGCAVGGGGDVNHDGFDDVIVGAIRFDYDQSLEGAAFVYTGSAGGLSTAPVWRFEGNKADAQFGAAVGVAGKINNDDYADLVAGAPQYRIEGLIHGRAYAYFGSDVTGFRIHVQVPVLISGGP